MNSSIEVERYYWYKRFRKVTYGSLLASLVWTILMVLPFRPFSYIPPIIVGAGPGIWFVLAYVLFLVVGVGGFGVLSGLLYTIEAQENREIDSQIMRIAMIFLVVGFAGSCLLLAIGGCAGGYASTIIGISGLPIRDQLTPYVYPVTVTTLMTVAGAALTLTVMVRAKHS